MTHAYTVKLIVLKVKKICMRKMYRLIEKNLKEGVKMRKQKNIIFLF